MKTRVALFGPLPPPVGGMSVSFSHLANELSKINNCNLEFSVVDTRREKNRLFSKEGLCGLKSFLKAFFTSSVITFYMSTKSVWNVGFFLLLSCKLFRKKLIIRKAAGTDHSELNGIKSALSGFVLKRCDVYLAQTKKIVSLREKDKWDNVKWYPTTRPRVDIAPEGKYSTDGDFSFIFLGHVKEGKGVLDLIEVAKFLPEGIKIDVYGPLKQGMKKSDFENLENISYRGEACPADIASIISKYDALVLPTKEKSEGYPGVIFEAYSAGIPVIATSLGGIPEIVDESCGILVSPGDCDELRSSMILMAEDCDFYCSLKSGAEKMSRLYDSRKWAKIFVDICVKVSDPNFSR